MAGPINVVPVGFLDQLGLRRMGEMPPATADFVQPTVDLGEQYREWLAVVAATNGTNITANGDVVVAGTPDLSVAQGEFWWVQTATLAVVQAAATTSVVTPYWQIPNAGTFVRLYIGPSTTIAAGTSVQLVPWSQSIWLPPGARAAVLVQNFTGAGTQTFTVQTRYTVLAP